MLVRLGGRGSVRVTSRFLYLPRIRHCTPCAEQRTSSKARESEREWGGETGDSRRDSIYIRGCGVHFLLHPPRCYVTRGRGDWREPLKYAWTVEVLCTLCTELFRGLVCPYCPYFAPTKSRKTARANRYDTEYAVKALSPPAEAPRAPPPSHLNEKTRVECESVGRELPVDPLPAGSPCCSTTPYCGPVWND